MLHVSFRINITQVGKCEEFKIMQSETITCMQVDIHIHIHVSGYSCVLLVQSYHSNV